MKKFIFFIILLFSKGFCADWEIIYLASFPRSGNHWVRFLIEEATHIATSSIYRDGDYPHLPFPFPWGGYSTDHGYKGDCRYPEEREPVVLKTHYPYFASSIPFKQTKVTVCLIRHPIDAFYSFYAYRKKRGVKDWGGLSGNLPRFIRKWRLFYEFWESQPGVAFIRYEDLYQDPIFTLSKILGKIGYEVQPEDIKRAVERYPPAGGILKYLSQYSKEDIDLIYNELDDLLLKYGYL